MIKSDRVQGAEIPPAATGLSGLVITPQAEWHEEPTLPLSKYGRPQVSARNRGANLDGAPGKDHKEPFITIDKIVLDMREN